LYTSATVGIWRFYQLCDDELKFSISSQWECLKVIRFNFFIIPRQISVDFIIPDAPRGAFSLLGNAECASGRTNDRSFGGLNI
jgi:hypothetical protein